MERKYMMYEGEDTNTIDLLYEKETEECNGVKIIIPVKYQDAYQFRRKIKEQLCYFESVYFDVPDDSSITNDFTIIRHPDFQFSEMSTDQNIHICLDNVYYPIDFEKLGMSRMQFPIALRFSLSDGLFPTPNRESLRYTKEAKDIIMKKFTTVADYFVTKYNDTVEEKKDIKSMIDYLDGNGHYINLLDNQNYNIDPLITFSTVKPIVPTIEGVSILNFASLYKSRRQNMLVDGYPCKFYLSNRRIQDVDKRYVYGYNLSNILEPKTKVYIYKDRIPGIKKDYLRATCDISSNVYLVKYGSPMKLGKSTRFDITTYYHLLELKNYPKSKWRQVIKEYQSIMSMIEDTFINLDALEVTEEFIESRKKVKVAKAAVISTKRLKLQGEIVCKKGVHLLRYTNGKECKFDSQLYKLEDLHKSKNIKVYAKHEDAIKLDALYGVMGKQNMEVITFSDRELKIVEQLDIHNLISYDKFMEGKTAPFKRIITSTLINELMMQYRYIFDKSKLTSYTSLDLSDKIDKLADYRRKNYVQSNTKLTAAMHAVAQEHKLYDPLIYSEYLEIKDIFEKLSFLNPLCQRIGYYGDDDQMVNVMTDLFKYYKHRVDLKHYKLKINDEVLTEANLDQLV